MLVLSTDYQEANHKRPGKLKIINYEYLTRSQVADMNLCRIAAMHRGWLCAENESHAKRLIRFLAYVNQADWRAKRLLRLVGDMGDLDKANTIAQVAEQEFRQDKLGCSNQKGRGSRANQDEWTRFLASPLGGRIGMSLALQWRYNFGPLFGKPAKVDKDD